MNRTLSSSLTLLLFALVGTSSARAEPPAPASPSTSTDDLAQAKELNRKGLAFFDQGDYARALPFFLSSRALVPSHANARNVALCLDGLGREGEALRAYEELLRDHERSLSADERAATAARIEVLRRAVEPPAAPPGPPISEAPQAVSRAAAPAASPGPGEPGRWTAGVFLGYAGGPSLGSDAESQATETCGEDCPGTSGVAVGARVGYRLGSIFTVELTGGYLRLESAFQRDAMDGEWMYRLHEQLRLQGPFAGAGLSARLPILGERLGVVGRLGVAGLAARVDSSMTGAAIGEAGDPAPLSIKQERTAVWSASLLVTPEIGLEASFGGLALGAGLGVFVSALPGPSFGERRLAVTDASACPRAPASAEASVGACAPDSRVTSAERSSGAFVAFVPQISARYRF